ncbi:MAG: YbaN family protein [Deltaproteobacteria bacterium]|nr:YbaN family protein [Deltaproteobacteria bacterium]
MDGGVQEKPAARGPAGLRWAYFLVGWVFFALGLLGAFLPVLPTTPFMLLALWAFSQSSRRFHDWLYHHRVFGPSLQAWRRERVVPRGVKAVAFCSMVASLLYVGLRVRPSWWALGAMAGVMLAGALFLLSVPSRPSSAVARGDPLADPPPPADGGAAGGGQR